MKKLIKYDLINFYFDYKKKFFLKNFFYIKIIKGWWCIFKKFNFKNNLILEVLPSSTKKDIKFIFEVIFNVKVIGVNTLIKKINSKKKNKIFYKKKAYIKFLNFNFIRNNVFS